MRLFYRPSLILLATLGLGLVMGCIPSTPESAVDKPTPQAIESDTESPSSVKGTLSTTESSSTTENSPLADTAAKASSSTVNEPAAVFAEGNIAIRGADPVAYFMQGTYVVGSPEYTYSWGGATWQFANAEHRDLFVSNPGQYAPQYGGFCAWAVSEGYTAPVDPNAWDIVDGKLYLNFNTRIQRRWQQDIPGHIARADRNWPGVLDGNN